MILTLPHHPCFPGLPQHLLVHIKRTPKYIGFWKGGYGKTESFPDPQLFIDATWSKTERAIVVKYVESAPFVNSYRGSSGCRLCGMKNGYRERSDGTYTWPEGFGHYIAEHHLRPPQEFVEHALKKAATS